MSISDRKDVEKLTQYPIIGQVAQTSDKDPLVVVNNPKSPIAESFRSIRTNIEFLTQGKSKSTILVTGDMQSIGKTFNSINLASIYALYGKKTVLLGFDMRKPKVKDSGIVNCVMAATPLSCLSTSRSSSLTRANTPSRSRIICLSHLWWAMAEPVSF